MESIASGGSTRSVIEGSTGVEGLGVKISAPHCLKSELSIVKALGDQRLCKLALDLDEKGGDYPLANTNIELK